MNDLIELFDLAKFRLEKEYTQFSEHLPLTNLSFLEMVSSGIPGLTKSGVQKFCTMKILLPMGPPDAISADHEDFDFSDLC
ncbi:hypothetical protein M5K25_003138 [Dendrobium thyrsiflorum]|uniref:Uncharacterized protein n=1 Tax=Dendrobium thyrsiflorum TaxID=117978 RepID=A0ABD0VQ25_DENTH